jgi:hypothetical protein
MTPTILAAVRVGDHKVGTSLFVIFGKNILPDFK